MRNPPGGNRPRSPWLWVAAASSLQEAAGVTVVTVGRVEHERARERHAQFDGIAGQTVTAGNGMPNTLMFQIRPLARTQAQCSSTVECCDQWRAQTPHAAMTIGMADGSVRSVSRGISQDTWNRVMQPRDGQAIGEDW